MNYKQLTLLACATLLASNVAFAAGPVKFKAADVNGDGFVDSDEFAKSGVKKKMKSLDRDKDGKLSAKEYSAVFDEECE